jgi:hypothetical protein
MVASKRFGDKSPAFGNVELVCDEHFVRLYERCGKKQKSNG